MKSEFSQMKWIFLFLFMPAVMWSQQHEQQTGDYNLLLRPLIPESKQGLLSRMSMIANMQFALRNEFYNGDHTQTRFRK
jgi:hypothetical protein